MAGRKKIIDGTGCVLKKGGTAIGNLTRITLPGWAKTEIDDTALDNVDVKTAIPAKLKKYNNPTVTAKCDAQADIAEGNAEYTIELPDNVGSLVLWMDILSDGDTSFEPDTGATTEITFLVTNLNDSGAVTKPVLTFSGAAAKAAAQTEEAK